MPAPARFARCFVALAALTAFALAVHFGPALLAFARDLALPFACIAGAFLVRAGEACASLAARAVTPRAVRRSPRS